MARDAISGQDKCGGWGRRDWGGSHSELKGKPELLVVAEGKLYSVVEVGVFEGGGLILTWFSSLCCLP